MSKIGRASRNASLLRVESVATAQSPKTIADAESGELYLINGADNVVINLPAVKEGAYFKFLITTAVGGGKSVTIQAAPNTVNIDGHLAQLTSNVTPTNADATAAGELANNVITRIDQGAAGDDKVIFGTGCTAGSFVECVCDGTKWIATGRATGGTLLFAAT